MQISIAQELTGLPKFRTQYDYGAYAEGWGLYSESLAKEMGFYVDPYSDFGRLSPRDLARHPPGGRHRHPRQGLERGAGARLLHRQLAAAGRRRSAPRSSATSSPRARRPPTRSAMIRIRALRDEARDGAGREVRLPRLPRRGADRRRPAAAGAGGPRAPLDRRAEERPRRPLSWTTLESVLCKHAYRLILEARTMDRVTGGCLCGDVRIVASGRPYRVGLCHCLDCRKHHGALFLRGRDLPAGGGDDRWRNARLRRAAFLPALRLIGFRAQPKTRSNCIWEPWTPPTSSCRPTKAGPSAARPGCRRFRSRDDTSAIVSARSLRGVGRTGSGRADQREVVPLAQRAKLKS